MLKLKRSITLTKLIQCFKKLSGDLLLSPINSPSWSNSYQDILLTRKVWKKKNTRGPRATVRSPEWHSHCRHADVMQHFSNPIIATNEISFEQFLVLKNIWAWQSMEHDYLNKLSITFQQKDQCEIWWKLAKWFLKNHDFIQHSGREM